MHAPSTAQGQALTRSARLASVLAILLVLADWALTLYMNAIVRLGVQPANDLEWIANRIVWGVLLPSGWLAVAVVGAIILSLRPDNTIGWLCLAFGAFGALENLPWQLARVVASPWWAGMLSLTASVFYALYLPTTLTLLLLHFPNGRYLSHRWRSIGLIAAASAALAIFAAFIRPVTWVGNEREAPNPLWLMAWSRAASMRTFSWALSQAATPLRLITQGKNNVEIADRLSISLKTLSNHISNIFNKLQVADRAQAIVKARDAGLR